MKAPQPIPYQGSKRTLAPLILQYFPKKVNRVVEPFAGSAAITVASAIKNKTNQYWINDLNKPLIDLLSTVIEDPNFISKKYSEIWNEQLGNEKEYYKTIRARFNESHKPEDFLFILARCVKGAVRYNSIGDFNQSPDNRRKGKNPINMEREIQQLSRLLKGKVVFTAMDYRDVFDKALPTDLIYMDPPYQGTSGNRDLRYFSGLDFNEFIDSLQSLNKKNIPYLVSYDGKLGDKVYGYQLPERLGLHKILIEVGRSTTSTLLGNDELTYESLYLSDALVAKLGNVLPNEVSLKPKQLQLL